MRYKRAVEKLRILAETCERMKIFWYDTEPFLKAVYAFGEVLDGARPARRRSGRGRDQPAS